MVMVRFVILVVLSSAALSASAAGSVLYECTDQNGGKRFTNIDSEAKGCRVLNVGPINTIAAPPPSAAVSKPQSKPAASGGTGLKTTASPASFPKVDAQTQQQRDVSRRRILEQELATEQKLLEQAQRELAEQESVRNGDERNYQRVLDRLEGYQRRVKQHADNVANLKREMANLR